MFKERKEKYSAYPCKYLYFILDRGGGITTLYSLENIRIDKDVCELDVKLRKILNGEV